MKSIKIGISGGTFDPLHIGHLIIAEEVRDYLVLEKILFIPVGKPPHKDVNNVTPSSHRMEMVRRAVENNNFFEALDIEVKRDGYTYAIDTLTELSKIYNDASFYYIIGADVVFDLLTWKDYLKVFEMCGFIAVMRPGYDKLKLLDRIDELRRTFGVQIIPLEVPLIGVSSTLVRERIKSARSVRYLLPERVLGYIEENDLYR